MQRRCWRRRNSSKRERGLESSFVPTLRAQAVASVVPAWTSVHRPRSSVTSRNCSGCSVSRPLRRWPAASRAGWRSITSRLSRVSASSAIVTVETPRAPLTTLTSSACVAGPGFASTAGEPGCAVAAHVDSESIAHADTASLAHGVAAARRGDMSAVAHDAVLAHRRFRHHPVGRGERLTRLREAAAGSGAVGGRAGLVVARAE
jgi:hypothetical protein